VVRGDGHKLRQIFTNLLSNAIKFTERGQVIWRLHGERAADAAWRLRVDVEDTGPGIPAADLGRIFDAFVQTPTGASTAGGTGLGLAISREFVRLMVVRSALTARSARGVFPRGGPPGRRRRRSGGWPRIDATGGRNSAWAGGFWCFAGCPCAAPRN